MQFFKWLGTKLCDFGSWVWSGPQQSHPSLFQLRAFWAMVLLPIGLAIVIAFFIAQGLHYPDVLLTKEGFDNAYECFKIPLWIAALSLPLAGFYATNYRSVETAKQITIATTQMKMTSQKNNFENNIKHREYFLSELKTIENKLSVKFKDEDELYNSIFTNNDFDFFSPWADDMEYLKFGFEEEDIKYKNYFYYISSLLCDVEKSLDLGDFREASKCLSILGEIFNLSSIGSLDLSESALFAYLSYKKIYPIEVIVSFYQTMLNVDYMLSSISLTKNKRWEKSNDDFHLYIGELYHNYYHMFDKPVFRSNGVGHVEEVIDPIENYLANERIKSYKTDQWRHEMKARFDTHNPASP
jgi:hypothetical protein